MNNRTISATMGRRVIWAGLTLSLLGLAGVQVSPPRSPEQRRIPSDYAMAHLLDSGCLDPSATQAEIDEYIQQLGYTPDGPTPPTDAAPEGLEPVIGEATAWTYFNASHAYRTGPKNTAGGATVRYSFPGPDVSGLFAELQKPNRFPNDRDHGLELIRQGMAAWARNSGLHLVEVADPNDPISIAAPAVADLVDIRIWGKTTDTSGLLGWSPWPITGGDLWLAANPTFTARSDALFREANSYRLLRNTTTHEFGHALGFYHAQPATRSQTMESPVPQHFEGLSFYEKIIAARYYGDRYTARVYDNENVVPNWTLAHAVDFGDLTYRSVFEPDLSTNGFEDPAGEDWFTFTLTSPQDVTITVNPTGGTFWGAYSTGGTFALRHAEQAGNLAFTLKTGAGSVVSQRDAGGLGETESVSLTSLPAGAYSIRVYDAGPANVPANLVTQLYDLSLRVGESLVPPRAVAGIHKRVLKNANCHFMSQFYSRALEAGAEIVAYEWDFDNDFIADSTQSHATHIFTTTGTKTVRLRVQDSFGTWSDWDEIEVDVFE